MQFYRIHDLNPCELEIIIGLHQQILTESTLNRFGGDFLKLIYKTAAKSPENIFIVIKDQESIVGFVVASRNIQNFYRGVIKKFFFNLIWQSFKLIFREPKTLTTSLLWFFTHRQDKQYFAELQFIVIDRDYQGQGWGSKLIRKLDESFKVMGVKSYKVGTWKNNQLSNKFYQKNSFKFVYEDKILGESFNYYIKNL